MRKILEWIQNVVDPNYWATKIGEKSGLYEWAMKSPLRKWALSLTGWKWWFYQIVVCGIIFLIVEWLLNQIGMTMLPWK
jgi:hypothetical protein|tara:strand:+ start:663 stop:899 length:237 start_codon:yes stop_codon:yes gene_type:complete